MRGAGACLTFTGKDPGVRRPSPQFTGHHSSATNKQLDTAGQCPNNSLCPCSSRGCEHSASSVIRSTLIIVLGAICIRFEFV